jgi:serine/threonine protein phosphatase PrpC
MVWLAQRVVGSSSSLFRPSRKASHYHPHRVPPPRPTVRSATTTQGGDTFTRRAGSSIMRPVPLFLSVAAALTLRQQHTTTTTALGESKHQQQQQQYSSFTSSNNNNEKENCPFYGCPLTPQDAFYNSDVVKSALQALREIKRSQVQEKGLDAYQEALKTSGNTESVTLTLIGNKGGPMQDQINQDRAVVIKPFVIEGADVDNDDTVLMGVFDGHAPRGEIVSEYTRNELPNLLSTKLAMARKDGSALERSVVDVTKDLIIQTFVELDANAPAEESGGCTATVILQRDSKIYIANAGDSRSFVAVYRPSLNKVEIVYMSREDKPDLPDERARVEKMGGQVYIPPRGTSRVVYHDPKSGAPSGLAMSRSIGDWAAGKLGVIPDPIVGVIDVPALIESQMNGNDEDTYLYEVDAVGDVSRLNNARSSKKPVLDDDDVYIFAVSATDGMMDYLEPTSIAAIMAKSLFDEDGVHPITAAEHLVFAAANAWQSDKSGRYRDDIAIAVSTLRRPPVKVAPVAQ